MRACLFRVVRNSRNSGPPRVTAHSGVSVRDALTRNLWTRPLAGLFRLLSVLKETSICPEYPRRLFAGPRLTPYQR